MAGLFDMGFDKLYKGVCKWYAIIPPFITVVSSFINAPFGRFALSNNVPLQVDGVKSWIVMELVSPITFLYSFNKAPLSIQPSVPSLHPSNPSGLMGLLFLIHYANRAVISPLRTPSRSKAHIIVPLCAITFNTINGTLMGSYLTSSGAQTFLQGAFSRPSFWFGVTLWALGFVGNILHDEILLRIRRNVKKKSDDGKQHYAIPYGYLYKYISYPNYFCEWVEWLGFALAAAPFPGVSLTTATPPWLFIASEVFLMAPRAVQGHAWYHQKFKDYPKERRAVIPFIL